jgi:hypothetical protein
MQAQETLFGLVYNAGMKKKKKKRVFNTLTWEVVS